MSRMEIGDLPPELVGANILTRVPITSLRAVRSTCRLWKALTKDWILGKKVAATQPQFLGFMTMNSKVCSLRYHLSRKEDSLDLSIKQVDSLSQVEISRLFHCDGLLLCVAKDTSKLVLWNPYLGQSRSIGPRTNFHRLDSYALGYDMNRNHKILRFVDGCIPERVSEYEIYNMSSNTWRVLNVSRDWEIESHSRGVSVKGSTYFFAREDASGRGFTDMGNGEYLWIEEDTEDFDTEDFLLCFDFTRESFGPRLPLPFHSEMNRTVTLSCVRGGEQLAVLYQEQGINDDTPYIVHIWVTSTIEPNSVSWSKFLKVEMKPFSLSGVLFEGEQAGSFFIDEEEKVAVVFDLDGYLSSATWPITRNHTAFIIGEDGYYNPVSVGVAPKILEACLVTGYVPQVYCPPLLCSSSYLPSLVQVKLDKQRKRKQRDV